MIPIGTTPFPTPNPLEFAARVAAASAADALSSAVAAQAQATAAQRSGASITSHAADLESRAYTQAGDAYAAAMHTSMNVDDLRADLAAASLARARKLGNIRVSGWTPTLPE